MTPQQLLLVVFGGLLGALLLASGVSAALLRRATAGAPTATLVNLSARVKAWWIMVAVLAAALLLGDLALVLLFAFVSFAALREFVTLLPARRGDHWALLGSFLVVLPLQYYWVSTDWYGLYSIFIPVYVFLALPLVVAVRGDTTDFIGRVADLQWGLMIAVYCVSHVPALLTLDIPGFEGRNVLLVAYLLLVVQASDVLQYVWGKLFGRTKLAPRLSPSKTVEGAVGGCLSAALLGAALWWATPFTPVQAFGYALLLALLGLGGGLIMSAIKRDRGVKDWGWMIEGHGGILDRVDSVVFAGPVFFHLLRYSWTP